MIREGILMEGMLSVEEAALRLGLRPSTLRAWILRRRIEYVKLSRAVRIPQKEIDRLIRENTVPAKPKVMA